METDPKIVAGNWKKFDCFVWHRRGEVADPDEWGIIYTSGRDSGLLTRSNEAEIAKILDPFTEGDDPDLVAESHFHWACGHLNGYSIRVYHDGELTPVFLAYISLAERCERYPILNEDDYSQREYDATITNIREAGLGYEDDYNLPDDWAAEVYGWLSDNDGGAIENTDDQGGYPDDDELLAAFAGLGYLMSNEV